MQFPSVPFNIHNLTAFAVNPCVMAVADGSSLKFQAISESAIRITSVKHTLFILSVKFTWATCFYLV